LFIRLSHSPTPTLFPYTTLFRSMSLSQTESITDKTVSNADLSGAKLEGRSGSTTNFIREIIEADLKAGLHDGRVRTRFPPEPNRSEEHTSELQSRENLVCRLLLE